MFNHRAFLEALCIGNILREKKCEEGESGALGRDSLFARGREDIGTLSFSVDSSFHLVPSFIFL